VLSSFLFHVSVLDVATFAGAALLLLLVALSAAYMPARRAGRIDPLITMK
jgi:ABC-type lipoprotein release transport system permease subunit